MARRIINPQRFLVHAALTDWNLIAKETKRDIDANQIAKQRRISPRMVQLRWLIDPKLGYPTEPFKVWRRPSEPMKGEQALGFSVNEFSFAARVVNLHQPVCFLRVRIQTNGAAMLMAYSGAPFNSAVVETMMLNNGIKDYVLSANSLSTLLIYGDAHVQTLTGITGEDAASDDNKWELVETVGLPVDQNVWSGVANMDAKQGLTGAETTPQDAALDRFNRGAPFFGWHNTIASGKPAPAWRLAEPKAILKGYEHELDGHMRHMIQSLPPMSHGDYGIDQTMAVNDGSQSAETRYRPLCTLVMGAASDPLFSLVAGFGTAFEDIDIPTITFGAFALYNDPNRSDWDYMVTAYYAKGASGQGETQEYAALIRAPRRAMHPAAPANLSAFQEGLTPPDKADRDYKGVIGLSWDKLPDMTPFRIASYAFARTGVSPASAVVPLMEDRIFDAGVPHPISATTSPENEASTGKLYALDENYALKNSNTPDSLHYGVAHQDIFGLWSAWSDTSFSIAEPPVQTARILSTRLEPVAGVSPVCDASLVVDVAWDWSVRTPKTIELGAQLYAAAKAGAYPASALSFTGFQKAFPPAPASQENLFTIQFDANGKATPAYGKVEYITEDSKSVSATPVLTKGPRRYRLTIPHFKLDFASNGHAGIGLWARGTEARSALRVGAWSAEPKITTASDPRPPVIVKEVEHVEFASLPDGRGEHRAMLDWSKIEGVDGYYVYTATETAFRAFFNMGDPLPGKTLAERLKELRQKFQTHPERRVFTRVNDKPLDGQRTEVIIPRGSKEIHMYVVTGVSAGQVESVWPVSAPAENPPAQLLTTGKRFRAFAAPQVLRPASPTLEVVRKETQPDTFCAHITLRTRLGADVSRVELFRTRVGEAALNVDTMGMPIATLIATDGGWTVAPDADTSQNIGVIKGFDPALEGSWKSVYYRAVAWSEDKRAQGLYGGRSDASSAMEVVIPPSTPPVLGNITLPVDGASALPVEFALTAAVPIGTTPLGSHRVRVEAVNIAANGTTTPLFAWPTVPPNSLPADRIQDIPTTANAAFRRSGTDGNITLHVNVSKKALADKVRIRVLVTDPLGRATEKVLTSAAGSAPVASVTDLFDPQIKVVTGKGYILSVKTHAPVAPSHRLNAQFTVAPARLQLPVKLTASVLLSDIPQAIRGLDPFASTVKLPILRSATSNGVTTLAFYLRTKGQLEAVLTGPKNQQATLKQKVT